jgi:division protein CdvB (Snf7/Vps24/ESCRT-III family)
LFTLCLIVFIRNLGSLVQQILANFASRWDKPANSDGGVGSRIRDSLKSSEPIKPKLDQATRQIQAQVAKLDQASSKLRERDTVIFSRVVSSIQKNDNTRANMLANELSEIRKMGLVITQAKLALEQLVLRLSTVTELGDLAVTLTPALNVIKGVRPGLVSLVPEAEREIGEISGLLSGILVEAGQISPAQLNFEASNEEAERVLEEAGVIARNNMSSKFPEIPEIETREAETE